MVSMLYTLRTRIKKDIVAEFLPPSRNSRKFIILCSGMPGYPAKKKLMFFLAKRGYWVFVPRYRGSWESDGLFLRTSPHLDIKDVMDALESGFSDLWSGKKYTIQNPSIYLIGSSFGGPAVILASQDPRVKKAVALSPVTDWRVETTAEPLNWLAVFTQKAFGNGYRFTQKDWQKLRNGIFYNPMTTVQTLDKNKIMIFHARDDEIVYARTSIAFAKKLGCKLTLFKKGGHLGTSILQKPFFWKKIQAFFKT